MESVRFLETRESGVLSLLEVESTERLGLLGPIARMLLEQRVQLVGVESTDDGSKQIERFTLVELDGAPIRPARRLELQVAVLTALDRLRRAVPRSGSPEASVVPRAS